MHDVDDAALFSRRGWVTVGATLEGGFGQVMKLGW